jgi:tetratricopeptide (TPR) repeat protein
MRDIRRAPTNPRRWWLRFAVTFLALFTVAALAVLYRALGPSGWRGAPTDDQLFAAIARGDAEEVRGLLEAGAWANALGGENKNKSALAIAVRTGNHDVIRALVEHGAQPWAGLVEAVVTNQLEILRLLLSLGVLEGGRGTEGTPALVAAVANDRRDAADLLLAAGAEVDPIPGLESPLHAAAERGSEPWVELLLKHKARVDTRRHDRLSAVDLAVKAGNVKLAERFRAAGAPESGFLDLRAGFALALDRKHAEAIPHLRRAVELAEGAEWTGAFEFVLDGWKYHVTGGTNTALAWLGECYQKTGRPDDAKRVFIRALASRDVSSSGAVEAIGLFSRSKGGDGGEGHQDFSLSARSLVAAARDGRAPLQVWSGPLDVEPEKRGPLLTGTIR